MSYKLKNKVDAHDTGSVKEISFDQYRNYLYTPDALEKTPFGRDIASPRKSISEWGLAVKLDGSSTSRYILASELHEWIIKRQITGNSPRRRKWDTPLPPDLLPILRHRRFKKS